MIELTKDFFLRELSKLCPTVENWHPCEPLLQTRAGKRYYVGLAVFVFLDGRQVLRTIYVGQPNETYNDVFTKTLKLTSQQEPISIEYALSLW